MSRESSLAHWAALAPEAPFVFFRGERGHFEWISFEDAEALRQGTPRTDRWLPSDVTEFLRFAAEVEAPASPAPVRPGPARDIWIAWRPLAVGQEAELAAWAVRTGAAIVVERHDRIPIELIEWARPTLLSGPAESLIDLLRGLQRDAPKWLRRRWLGQRLGRLRAIFVDGAPSEASIGEIGEIVASLERIVPGRKIRCARLSSAALEALV